MCRRNAAACDGVQQIRSGAAGHDGVARRAVGQPSGADRGVQSAGECGAGAVDAGASPPAGQLGLVPGGDVPLAQVGQLEPAERRNEVVVHVVAVAGEGGGLEHVLLGAQPAGQIAGHGQVVVAVQAGALAFEGVLQRPTSGFATGEAAAALLAAASVSRGRVEGVGPGAMARCAAEAGAPRAELLSVGVAAAASPVDPSTVRMSSHLVTSRQEIVIPRWLPALGKGSWRSMAFELPSLRHHPPPVRRP